MVPGERKIIKKHSLWVSCLLIHLPLPQHSQSFKLNSISVYRGGPLIKFPLVRAFLWEDGNQKPSGKSLTSTGVFTTFFGLVIFKYKIQN